jgi:hypothetical protein
MVKLARAGAYARRAQVEESILMELRTGKME